MELLRYSSLFLVTIQSLPAPYFHLFLLLIPCCPRHCHVAFHAILSIPLFPFQQYNQGCNIALDITSYSSRKCGDLQQQDYQRLLDENSVTNGASFPTFWPIKRIKVAFSSSSFSLDAGNTGQNSTSKRIVEQIASFSQRRVHQR